MSSFSRLLLFFIFALIPFYTVSATPSQQQFIALSDLHFDPFVGCHFKKYCRMLTKLRATAVTHWHTILKQNIGQQNARLRLGQDTNLALLSQTTKRVKEEVNQRPIQFIVITGDFLGHHFLSNYKKYFGSTKSYRQFVRNTFQFLYQTLRKAIPAHIPLYFVMGNNDGYLGDYVINADHSFFKDITNDWPELNYLPALEKSKYWLDSYGAYAATKQNLRLVILNSNLLYKTTKGSHKEQKAKKMLDWLEQQLSFAKQHHQKALLFYHIPFGIQPKKKLLPGSNRGLWIKNANRRYIQIEKDYKQTILGMIHGHVHRSLFMKLHIDHAHPMPQYLVSSVSPVFGNRARLGVFTIKGDELTQKKIRIDR